MWEAISWRLRKNRKVNPFIFILNSMRETMSVLVILTCFTSPCMPDTRDPKFWTETSEAIPKINLYLLHYLWQMFYHVARKSSWNIWNTKNVCQISCALMTQKHLTYVTNPILMKTVIPWDFSIIFHSFLPTPLVIWIHHILSPTLLLHRHFFILVLYLFLSSKLVLSIEKCTQIYDLVFYL